jgi:hypothetical protein
MLNDYFIMDYTGCGRKRSWYDFRVLARNLPEWIEKKRSQLPET